jgi:hypothetical protein
MRSIQSVWTRKASFFRQVSPHPFEKTTIELHFILDDKSSPCGILSIFRAKHGREPSFAAEAIGLRNKLLAGHERRPFSVCLVQRFDNSGLQGARRRRSASSQNRGKVRRGNDAGLPSGSE